MAGATLLERELGRLLQAQRLTWPLDAPTPRWATAARVQKIGDAVDLRIYGDSIEGQDPVLIVTPQVNHSYIADFSPEQSLVRTLRSAGAAQVAVTDWLPPPPRPYHIADSIDDVVACAAHLGGRVHLVGLCQGGWQAAITAALHPDRAASLTIAAAPIDTRRGWTPLHLLVHSLPMAWYRGLVAAAGGVAPGAALAAGFDLLRAHERFVLAPLDLYLHADDPEWCARYEALRNWYRLNKDLAGPLYLEAVEWIFKKNLLARGRMRLRGHRVDLGAIRCPVRLVAGRQDHITPPAQVFALARLAPRAASLRETTVDAGHIGVFMGRKALSEVWPELIRGLLSEADGSHRPRRFPRSTRQ